MKRRIVPLLIAFLILVLQGCSFPESHPIEGTQNILVAGIDVDGDNIVLTMYTDKISAGGSAGGEQVSYELYVSKGKTLFDADHMIHEFNSKYLSWIHTKYILVGEDAAKAGLDRLFSYFTEDDETRMLYRTAIVKGMNAQDFLKAVSKRKDGLADYLDTLFGLVKKTGMSREIHLINYEINRNIPWNDVFIPTVELNTGDVEASLSQSGSQSGDSGGEQEPLIQLQGFALFRGDKLCGFLENDQARALNILNDELYGSQVTVIGKNGHSVALEIMKSDTVIKPNYDPLSVSIEVSMNSNLTEFHDGDNPMDADEIKYLEQQQNETIETEITEAIKYMQQVDCDAADIGDKFYHKDPVKWQGIKDNWKQVFPQLQFTVKVDTKIKSTYELKEPIS